MITKTTKQLPFYRPSSIIRKVCEDSVEGSRDEEDHSGSLVYPKGYLDLLKFCTELEQDQDHVEKPQDENSRNFADLHMKSSNSLAITSP